MLFCYEQIRALKIFKEMVMSLSLVLSLEEKLMMVFLGAAVASVSSIELQCAGLLLSWWLSLNMDTVRHSHPLAYFMDGFVPVAAISAASQFA